MINSSYYQLDTLATLCSFAAVLGIGLLAFLRWKSAPLRFWFAVNCGLAAFWCLNDFAGGATSSRDLFIFTLRAGSLGWLFLGPALFIFLAFFLGRENLVRTRGRRLLLLALELPFGAMFWAVPEVFFPASFSPEHGHYQSVPTLWFAPLLLSIIGWVAAQVWIISSSLRRQSDPLTHERSRLLGLILLLVVVLALLTDVILPALDYCSPTSGGIFIGWFFIAVFALIQRFQLLPSAQVLSAKVDQLQEFNRTLEQKVEERTRELRESEQRYREIFENVQDFIFSLDLEGRFTSANPQMERVTGVREKEVAGKSLFQVIGENYPPHLLEVWNRDWNNIQAQIRAPENLYRNEVLLPTSSGEERNVIFTWSGIFRKDKLAGYLGLGRDVTESQRAEEALRESETRHREIFESVQEFILALDLEGRITSANPQVKQTIGFKTDYLVGKKLAELIEEYLPPPQLEHWKKVWLEVRAKVQKPGDLFREEVFMPIASGELRAFVFIYSGIFREGRLVGYLHIGRDVTESRRAEDALQESEARYREIFENVQEFILSLDLEGRITSANPQVKQTMDFKTDTLVGKKLVELIEEYLSPRMREHWKKIWLEIQAVVQKPGDLFREEVFMPIASGELRTFVYIYSGIFRQGRLVGYLNIGRDVTAEKAIQESEARYREIFENIQELLFYLDRDGRVTSANPQIERYTGSPLQDAIGNKLSEVIAKNFPAPILELWEKDWQEIQSKILLPQDVVIKEGVMPKASGELAKVLYTYAGIFREGKLVGYLGVGRDITESERLKAELQEYSANLERLVAERTKELEATYVKLAESARLAGKAEMAAGVLHNIGNAVNSIGVRLEMIRAHICQCPMENVLRTVEFLEQQQDRLGSFFGEDPKGRQVLPFLRELALSTQPVRAQIKETLEFTRSQLQHIAEIITVEQRYHRPGQWAEPADLNQVIREALSLLQDSLNRRGVRIEQDLADLPLLALDRSQAIQAAYNLLKNAVEAVEKNPEGERRIRVQTRIAQDAAGEVEIVVEDNGIGIRPEDLPRLFQFGFTTRAERGGHGFGLHASANYIQSLGGRIEAESQGPGRGAVFHVYLPLGAEQETAAARLEKEEDHEPAHIGD